MWNKKNSLRALTKDLIKERHPELYNRIHSTSLNYFVSWFTIISKYFYIRVLFVVIFLSFITLVFHSCPNWFNFSDPDKFIESRLANIIVTIGIVISVLVLVVNNLSDKDPIKTSILLESNYIVGFLYFIVGSIIFLVLSLLLKSFDIIYDVVPTSLIIFCACFLFIVFICILITRNFRKGHISILLLNKIQLYTNHNVYINYIKKYSAEIYNKGQNEFDKKPLNIIYQGDKDLVFDIKINSLKRLVEANNLKTWANEYGLLNMTLPWYSTVYFDKIEINSRDLSPTISRFFILKKSQSEIDIEPHLKSIEQDIERLYKSGDSEEAEQLIAMLERIVVDYINYNGKVNTNIPSNINNIFRTITRIFLKHIETPTKYELEIAVLRLLSNLLYLSIKNDNLQIFESIANVLMYYYKSNKVSEFLKIKVSDRVIEMFAERSNLLKDSSDIFILKYYEYLTKIFIKINELDSIDLANEINRKNIFPSSNFIPYDISSKLESNERDNITVKHLESNKVLTFSTLFYIIFLSYTISDIKTHTNLKLNSYHNYWGNQDLFIYMTYLLQIVGYKKLIDLNSWDYDIEAWETDNLKSINVRHRTGDSRNNLYYFWYIQIARNRMLSNIRFDPSIYQDLPFSQEYYYGQHYVNTFSKFLRTDNNYLIYDLTLDMLDEADEVIDIVFNYHKQKHEILVQKQYNQQNIECDITAAKVNIKQKLAVPTSIWGIDISESDLACMTVLWEFAQISVPNITGKIPLIGLFDGIDRYYSDFLIQNIISAKIKFINVPLSYLGKIIGKIDFQNKILVCSHSLNRKLSEAKFSEYNYMISKKILTVGSNPIIEDFGSYRYKDAFDNVLFVIDTSKVKILKSQGDIYVELRKFDESKIIDHYNEDYKLNPNKYTMPFSKELAIEKAKNIYQILYSTPTLDFKINDGIQLFKIL